MTINRITGISALTSEVKLVLCDLWGVVHNGRQAFPEAVDCLYNLTKKGVTVYLVSNAPRPSNSVIPQLQGFGVPDDCYSSVVTSGDMTWAAISGRLQVGWPGRNGEFLYSLLGKVCLHLGPERDSALFEGLKCTRIPWNANADLDLADFILCTGLMDDEAETAEDYREMLEQAAKRKLLLICANPDLTVMRGVNAIPCAGAVASVYESVGGTVKYFGKPYPEIYQFCLDKWRADLTARGLANDVTLDHILAVGDSLRTDIAGARRMGIRSVFITDGIHSEELGAQPGLIPDSEKIEGACAAIGVMPEAVMANLVW